MYYILDNHHNLIPVTLMEWARWFDTNDRHVALTYTLNYEVSTIFMGLDHSFRDTGPPVVFETMVFAKGDDDPCDVAEYMDRYHTWDKAIRGHDAVVRHVTQLEIERIRHEEEL